MEQNMFYNNLAILSQINPKLAEKINAENVDSNKYIIEHTREAADTLKILNGDSSFYLHSKFFPKTEAEEWIAKNMDEQNEIHILFGFALGYYYMELAKRIPATDRIFIFEPDVSIFKLAIQNNDIRDFFSSRNVIVCIGDIDEFKNILSTSFNYNFINKIDYLYLPNYPILFKEEVNAFDKIIYDLVLSKVVNRNTFVNFAGLWQENLLQNIQYLFDSCMFSEFEQKLKNIPMIIVSAGPSLTKNVSMLKKVQGRAVIVSVGRALRVLLNEGIRPDIVAALDGSELCAQQFDGLEYSDMYLLYTSRVNSRIVKNHRGRKILNPNFEPYVNMVLRDMGIAYEDIACGNSVATMIYAFACLAGGNPVAFVGQDLAYSGSETHAKGTYYGNNKDVVIEENDTLSVPGIKGGEVVTGKDLYIFLRWFESEIARDKTGRTYINATEGGANIEGTIVKTLEEFIEEYCIDGVNARDALDSVFKNRKIIDIALIRDYVHGLEQLPDNMNEIISLCKKALRYNDEIYRIYKLNLNKNVRGLVEKLNEIDRTLLSKQREFALLENIMVPVYDKVIANKRLLENSTEREQGLYSAEMSETFYKNIKEEIEKTKPMVIELIKKMKEKYPEEGGIIE